MNGLAELLLLLSCGILHANIEDGRYIGCYVDDNSDRIFPKRLEDDDSMTTASCINECILQGYYYAAAQFGKACFCGLETTEYGKLGGCDDADECCDVPCSGDSDINCGGLQWNSVYRAECPPGRWGVNPVCGSVCICKDDETCDFETGECPTRNAPQSKSDTSCNDDERCLGCYTDSVNDRVFTDRLDDDKEHMTPDLCNNQCISKNSSYSATQVGYACFCGTEDIEYDRLGSCGAGDAPCCSTRCPGDNTLLCGGPSQNSVYSAECPRGRWSRVDPVCDEDCYCKNGDKCNLDTGACPAGCAAGWQDTACNIECTEGTYGVDCTGVCHCIGDDVCDRYDGSCPGECAAGWNNPPYCQNECQNGTFGVRCEKHCNCLDICDKVDGTCPSDCIPGYQDLDCQTECTTGSFGDKCMGVCHCKESGECSHVTGECASNECESGWTDPPLCQTESSSDDTALIAGVVIAVLIVLVAAILAVIIIRKRRMQQRKSEIIQYSVNGNHVDGTEADLENKGFHTETPSMSKAIIPVHDTLYQNMAPDKRSEYYIRLIELEDYIANLKASKEGFSEEFEVPPGHEYACEMGSLPALKNKNRFRNIIAYDHSAVRLSGINNDENSEYINANYIKSYNREKEFIAAQGPNKYTLIDFWRMLWEQDVPVVVMVTNCKERGKNKCEQYWPETAGESLEVGDVHVVLDSQQQWPDFIIRCMTAHKNGDRKQIRHMHFTGWPDHGVPDYSNTLLNFRRKVRDEMAKIAEPRPTVVHCSAGVGRTGAFLALDYLVHQAEKEQAIDVFNYTQQLRQNRVNMIQTVEQYEFVYDSVLEWVTVGITTVPCFRFRDKYTQLKKPISKRGTSCLEEQFRLLSHICKSQDSEYESGRLPHNESKNRSQYILPVNNHRVVLITDVRTYGNYINAVFVNGHRKKDSYIVTQYPFPDTRGDLWRMIWDYQLPCVVCILTPKELKQETPLWSSGKAIRQEEDFKIQTKNSEKTDCPRVVKHDLEIAYKNMSARPLSIFEMRWLPTEGSEGPTEDLVHLHGLLQRWQQQTGHSQRPTVVMCMNGSDKSGIFCAASSLIDMINEDQEVDIFYITKLIRTSRAQFIPTEDQYQYLYSLVETYLESFSGYGNFQSIPGSQFSPAEALYADVAGFI